MAAQQFFSTQFLERIPRARDVATFRFDKPGGYEYQAGQWGVIEITRGGQTLSHHFTHASSPTEPYLDITTKVRNSAFKQALSALSPGDEVDMEGPFGSFVLADDIGRAVFLTGGIGITPARSILRYLSDSGIGMEGRNLVLIYGNRSLDEAVYLDELEQINDTLPYLEIIHVLEDPPANWTGHTGRIDTNVMLDVLDDMSGWHYFLSGPPGMVQSLNQTLRDRAIPKPAITVENFQGYD